MNFDRILIWGLLGLGLACGSEKGDSTESGTSDATTEPGTTALTTTSETDTGETTTTGTGTTEAPTTTTTTGETTTDDTTGDGFPKELAKGCGFSTPCGPVLTLRCGDDFWSEDCSEPYSAEAQCVLEKLAAGEGFALRYDLNGFDGEEEWYNMVFDGEGGAVRQRGFTSLIPPDDHEAGGPVERCFLKPPDFFAGCLAVALDDPAHAECMLWSAWFQSCDVDPDPVCPTP